MRVLVTGGAGFIGSNFVLQCLARETGLDTLVNLDLLTYAGNIANLAAAEYDTRYHFVHGNIGDRELVAELLTRHEIAAVVNFAAESHVDRSIDGPEAFLETNVMGTLRLLDSVRHYWKGLPEGRKKAFRFLRRTRFMGHWGRKIRPSMRIRRLRRTAHMRRRRHRATTWCGRTITLTDCRC